MYIDPQSTIAGMPAMAIRDFLRVAGDHDWSVAYAAERLGVTKPRARTIVDELAQLGYVQVAARQHGRDTWYTRTLAGSTLALASAARPLTRRSAEKKLQEFLTRVREVNSSDYYLYKVRRVLVFGSYLSDRDRINDIDIAVELVHRITDSEQRLAADRVRIDEAYRAGRRFPNIVAELYWPYQEVLLFLKARSRAISLHTTEDGIPENARTEVLFEDETAAT